MTFSNLYVFASFSVHMPVFFLLILTRCSHLFAIHSSLCRSLYKIMRIVLLLFLFFRAHFLCLAHSNALAFVRTFSFAVVLRQVLICVYTNLSDDLCIRIMNFQERRNGSFCDCVSLV